MTREALAAALEDIQDRSLIDIRDDGAIRYQSCIRTQYPDLDMDRLLMAVEDHTACYEDGSEIILWDGVLCEMMGEDTIRPGDVLVATPGCPACGDPDWHASSGECPKDPATWRKDGE